MLSGIGKPKLVFESGRTWRKTPSGPFLIPVMQLVAGGANINTPGRFEPGKTRAKHGKGTVLVGEGACS